jgi:hypothetical protein
MTEDMMDTDIATQLLNASSVRLGVDDTAVKNPDRKSFVYKIFTKIEFGRDDAIDPTTVRYRLMALSDAIVQATKGDSDSIYLATPDGHRIDPQSSPTNPEAFKTYVNWSATVGRQSYASLTFMLHSAIRYSDLKNIILPFLMGNRIFLNVNSTASSIEDIVRVAVIPFMNPDVTFRKGFSAELNSKLQAVVNAKNDEFKARYFCIKDDFKFDIVVSKVNEKMRSGKRSPTVPILMVESPKSQSDLCRNVLQEALNLMSPVSDAPSIYHCIPLSLKDPRRYPKGPSAVVQLLKQHQRYLGDFRSFQVKGVHRQTMLLLKSKIMTECLSINAIEPTFQTDEFGKWTVCTTTAHVNDAKAWIDKYLPSIMDSLVSDDKPSLPRAVVPHRVIVHNEVPDSQIDRLFALSGLNASTPTVNAWVTPPRTATTQPLAASFSTLTSPQSTTILEIFSQLKSIQTHIATTTAEKDKLPTPTSDHISDYITDQIIEHTSTIQSEFDERFDALCSDSKKQSVQISGILSKVDAQGTSIASINNRFDSLETNISSQLAPLNSVLLGGGLSAMIQQSLQACLAQSPEVRQPPNPVSAQPMDEDLISFHTPRRLYDDALFDSPATSSNKKRLERPSPLSRKGQATPMRPRIDDPLSTSISLFTSLSSSRYPKED